MNDAHAADDDAKKRRIAETERRKDEKTERRRDGDGDGTREILKTEKEMETFTVHGSTGPRGATSYRFKIWRSTYRFLRKDIKDPSTLSVV